MLYNLNCKIWLQSLTYLCEYNGITCIMRTDDFSGKNVKMCVFKYDVAYYFN